MDPTPGERPRGRARDAGCYLGLRGKESFGPEERAEQAQFDSDKGYKAALQAVGNVSLAADVVPAPGRSASSLGADPSSGQPIGLQRVSSSRCDDRDRRAVLCADLHGYALECAERLILRTHAMVMSVIANFSSATGDDGSQRWYTVAGMAGFKSLIS